jgi:hypothetical protein
METITCHDCAQPVSFSAAACPNCGSREPTGPYRHNRKEARRLGAEDKNDRTLIMMTVGLGAVGAFYGVETSSSALGGLRCRDPRRFPGRRHRRAPRLRNQRHAQLAVVRSLAVARNSAVSSMVQMPDRRDRSQDHSHSERYGQNNEQKTRSHLRTPT